ncbi:hypothetical protein DERF_005879 [Dermatophagoides farinae]|uniref:Uncharacterized protein n=1 Tax=Dermatophagoides farinae TaxID=6954 RepID=A0A922I4C8_DERFA|nr:hypothetical protein DERF_005879 [Dermatophagoides farinae]
MIHSLIDSNEFIVGDDDDLYFILKEKKFIFQKWKVPKYQIKDMRQEKMKNDPVNMINQSMIVYRNMIDKFLSDIRHGGGATTFTSVLFEYFLSSLPYFTL